MTTTKLSVQGMTCGHCVSHVTKALEALPGVQSAQVDLASSSATVTGDASVAAMLAAIAAEGYTAAVA